MKAALVALSLVCSAVSAQVPTVPTNVTAVQTLGYWQHDGRSGTYRVITTTEGWEHVWSRVFVEWLPEPASRDEPSLVSHTVELELPVAQGTTLVEARAVRRKTSTIEIKLVTQSNEVVHAKSQVYRFLATSPGVIKPVRNAKQ